MRAEEEGIGLGGDGEVYKNRAFAVRTEDIIMQRLCFLPFSNFFFFFLVMREKQHTVSPRSLSRFLSSFHALVVLIGRAESPRLTA